MDERRKDCITCLGATEKDTNQACKSCLYTPVKKVNRKLTEKEKVLIEKNKTKTRVRDRKNS